MQTGRAIQARRESGKDGDIKAVMKKYVPLMPPKMEQVRCCACYACCICQGLRVRLGSARWAYIACYGALAGWQFGGEGGCYVARPGCR